MATDETDKNYQPNEGSEKSDSTSPDDARSRFSEEADALFLEQASSSQERSKLVEDELTKLAMPASIDQGRQGLAAWNKQDQLLKDSGKGLDDGNSRDSPVPSKQSRIDDFNSRMDQLLNEVMKMGGSLLPTLELYDEKLRKASTY